MGTWQARNRQHQTVLTSEEKQRMKRFAKHVSVLLVSLLWSAAGLAAPGCPDIEQFLTGKAVGVLCFHSDDLRTNNSVTTPANNSITTFADGTPLPGLLAGANS